MRWMCKGWLVAATMILSAIAPAFGQATGGARQQLVAECDRMLRTAVKRSYGMAWGEISGEGEGRRVLPKSVRLDPGHTPAVGLVLWWAGRQLEEPRYTDAAWEVARGLMASQDQTGRIPSRAIFGPSAGGRDEAMAVADRSATRAALGLWLMMIADGDKGAESERLRRSTLRALNWLAKQQAGTGAWPSAFPPDAEPGHARRIVRLDDRDYRDGTLALYLGAEVLDDPTRKRLADKAVVHLISLRFSDRSGGPPLWPTAHPLGGETTEIPGIQHGVDVLASRYAMQTLLGAYLMSGERAYGVALDQAHQAVGKLPRDRDGLWDRLYAPKTLRPLATTRQSGLAEMFTPPAVVDAWREGRFGMEEMALSVVAVKAVGRDDYLALLKANLDVRQHAAAALCGLLDDPFSQALPVTRLEAEEYLQKEHETPFAEQSETGLSSANGLWRAFRDYLIARKAGRE